MKWREGSLEMKHKKEWLEITSGDNTGKIWLRSKPMGRKQVCSSVYVQLTYSKATCNGYRCNCLFCVLLANGQVPRSTWDNFLKNINERSSSWGNLSNPSACCHAQNCNTMWLFLHNELAISSLFHDLAPAVTALRSFMLGSRINPRVMLLYQSSSDAGQCGCYSGTHSNRQDERPPLQCNSLRGYWQKYCLGITQFN